MSQGFIFHRRRLPHLYSHFGVLFITIRNNDGIPKHLLRDYYTYANLMYKADEQAENPKESSYQTGKILLARFDEMLHKVEVKLNFTKNPEVTQALADTIHELAKTHYHLYAYTIMPNHVHLLIKPNKIDDQTVELGEIMRLIKGRSARRMNQILGRKGTVWQREYYDHYVRNMREFDNIVGYILENPVKAGLVSYDEKWKWSWVNMDE